jgi:hypothetical protein
VQKSHTLRSEITQEALLRVKITLCVEMSLVRVEITLWKNHSVHMTRLRVVCTLVRMKIRLISAEVTHTTFRNHTAFLNSIRVCLNHTVEITLCKLHYCVL